MIKKVKKFITFEDLKSYETKAIDYESSLKKHKNFEKVIKEIAAAKINKSDYGKHK